MSGGACSRIAWPTSSTTQVEESWRAEAWEISAALDWLILTKRPMKIRKMLPRNWGQGWPNIWLGTTAEMQRYAKQRLPVLLKVPAVVHFASCEPLLEALDLRSWLHDGLDWAIVGGESGNPHRPMELAWAHSLHEQCQENRRAFSFKQVSAFAPKDSDIPPDLADPRASEALNAELQLLPRHEPVERGYNRCPICAQKPAEKRLSLRRSGAAKSLKSGAGEGIRTLDPNLGKTPDRPRGMSLRPEVPGDPYPGRPFCPNSIRPPAAGHPPSAP